MALSILDRSIDRDIAAQRDDIANQRAGVGMQMNLLSQMRGQFSDERQAESAARVVMLETFKMKLEETAARSGSDRVRAQAASLYAQADQKEAALVGDMQIASAKEHVLGEKTMFGARTQRAALRAQQQAAQAKATAPVAFPGARIKAGPYVPNKDDFRKAKPMVAAYNDAAKKLDDLIAWRAKFGQEKLNIKQLGMANKKALRLRSAMRIIDETGARLDPGEIEMMGLDFEMGDLGFVSDYLKVIKESITTKVSEAISVRGFELEGAATPGAKRRAR